jgi:hypothetical protein
MLGEGGKVHLKKDLFIGPARAPRWPRQCNTWLESMPICCSITSGTVMGAFWSALAPIGVEDVETSENG